MKIASFAALALLVATPAIHARINQNHPFTEPRPAKQELFLDPTDEQLRQAIPARNTHCPVHGSAFHSDAKNVDVIYKGHVIRLDCAACKPEFARFPEKYANITIADTLGQVGH